MVKLFGYEHLVEQQIGSKRDDELKWIWKRKLIGSSLLKAPTLVLNVIGRDIFHYRVVCARFLHAAS
jgi:hypothetical protein